MRYPATTQSAVRLCFTLNCTRLLGSYMPAGRLGHDAVEPGALEAHEPVGGQVERSVVAGVRCTVGSPAGEGLGQQRPSLGQGLGHEVAVAERQQVEGDERRRRLRGQLA